jgi:hypothetical protein
MKTYTSNNEGQVLLGIEVLDRRVKRRRESILKQTRKVWILDTFLHVANHFLQQGQ